MSDSFILSDHAVNETRFQYERQNENHYPDSTDRTIFVQGDFTGGGYTGQVSRDHATRLEFWNITTISHGAQAIKFGTRMRDTRDANLTNANFNGSFTFANYQRYQAMANGLLTEIHSIKWSTWAMVRSPPLYNRQRIFDCQHVRCGAVCAGRLEGQSASVAFRRSALGISEPYSDHNDWAPRVSMAYALDGGTNNKKTKTVLRAGYGWLYDRLQTNSLLTVNRSNVQEQIVLNNPTCSSSTSTGSTANSLNQIDLTSCSGTTQQAT